MPRKGFSRTFRLPRYTILNLLEEIEADLSPFIFLASGSFQGVKQAFKFLLSYKCHKALHHSTPTHGHTPNKHSTQYKWHLCVYKFYSLLIDDPQNFQFPSAFSPQLWWPQTNLNKFGPGVMKRWSALCVTVLQITVSF